MITYVCDGSTILKEFGFYVGEGRRVQAVRMRSAVPYSRRWQHSKRQCHDINDGGVVVVKFTRRQRMRTWMRGAGVTETETKCMLFWSYLTAYTFCGWATRG